MGILIRTCIFSFAITILFSFVTVPFILDAVYAQNVGKVSSETDSGLYTVTIDTAHGKIRVNLPDDMAAGDTISGTVIAEPSGTNAEERRKNTDELNGYVVEVKTEEKELGETKIGAGKLVGIPIPGDLSGGPAKIVISDTGGEEIIVADIPVRDTPHPLQYT